MKDQKPEYEKALQPNLLMGVMDTNMDGKLSRAELRGKPGEMILKYFDIIDKNHDGFLDADELAAAQKLMGGRRMLQGGAPPSVTVKPAAETASSTR